MKLHLPKVLFTAVLTAVMAVPAAFATTLSDAKLALDGFTADELADASHWTLTNVTASDSGIYTVGTQARLSSDEAWQTMGSVSRSTWSGIITFNINSLSNANGILLEAVNGDTTAALNPNGSVGIGYDTSNSSKRLTGAWQGGSYSPNIANLATYADANGNVTVGVIYKEGNNGTTILVGNQTAPNTGLRGNDNANAQSTVALSALAGVKYSNLYLFSGAVSTDDMQAMMSELSTVNTLTWNGTEAAHTWNRTAGNTPWTNTDSGAPAAFTSKDKVTFGTLAEGISSTVTVDGFVNTNAMVVNDAYTLDGSGIVSAADLSGTGSLTLGDNVTLALTKAHTLASIDGSGTVTLSGVNQPKNGTTNLHLADSWTGTVKLENLTVANTNLADFSKNGSLVALNGVSGYLSVFNGGTCEQNLKLTDFGSKKALTINDGAAANTVTFSGAFTGDGTFATENSGAAANTDILFTGNLTEFEGNFSRPNASFSSGVSELKANSEGVLQFGSGGSVAPAVATYTDTVSKSEDGLIHNIAGSGNILSSSVVRFNYLASEAYTALGVDNKSITARYLEFNRDGGTADYVVSSDVTGHNATASNNTLKVKAGTTTMLGEVSNFGHILTEAGATLAIGTGGVLTVADGADLNGAIAVTGGTAHIGKVTVAADKTVSLSGTAGTLSFDGMLTNNGTLNLAGNISFDTTDLLRYERKSEGAFAGWSDAERSQGFAIESGASYYAIKGAVASAPEAVTINNGAITAAEDGTGYIFSMANSYDTTYVISANTATITEADADYAQAYNITAASTAVTVTGGTMDLRKADNTLRITALTLDGGNAIMSATDRGFSGNVTINSGSTLELSGNDAFVYNAAAHSKSITVNQGGTLACGDNRISLNGGYDIIVNGGTISGNGQVNTDGALGALDFFGDSTIKATGTTGEISAKMRVRNDKALTVEVQGASDKLKISGAIVSGPREQQDGFNGSLVKTGAGTLELSGISNYQGGTTVNAGTLKISAGGQTGAIKGALTINTGAKVDLAAGDALGWGTTDHVDVINIEGGELHVSVAGNGKNQTFSNTTLNLKGGSITGVNGSNIDLYEGSTTVHALAAEGATAANPTVSTVSGATLQLRENSTTFTVDANAKLVLNSSLKSTGVYTNALIVEGAGTLALNAAGTYVGGTTINGGTVAVGHATALGTGAVVVNEGAALSVADGVAMSVGTLTFADGAAFDFGTGASATVTNLTLGSGLVLGTNLSAALDSVTKDTSLTLFSGTTSLTIGGESFVSATDASAIFSGVAANKYLLDLTEGSVILTLASNDIVIDPSTDNQVVDGGTFDNLVVGEEGHSVKLAGDITITESIDMTEGGIATITPGATVTNKGVTITGTGADSAITASETGAMFAVTNADVTVAEGAASATLDGALVDSSVTNESGTSLDIAGAQNIITTMTIDNEGSSINFISGGEVVAEQITLGAGTRVGSVEAGVDEPEITVTGSLVVNGNADMNADLVMGNGSTLYFDGVLTMGSSVEFGDNVIIIVSDAIASQIASGDIVTLIDSIDADTDITSLSGVGIYTGSQETGLVYLTDTHVLTHEDGTFYVTTPEPATATLSLLALAGLCARRRRH